jgi:sugar lactone lactonase YvrE
MRRSDSGFDKSGNGRLAGLHGRLAADVRASIAECPVWDSRDGKLLWIDLPRGSVSCLRAEADGGGWRSEPLFELPGSIGAIVPTERGGYLVAAGTEIALVDDASGYTREVIAGIDADPSEVSFNDGKCDPAGRFWVGTHARQTGSTDGALYRLEADGSLREMLSGIGISNGLGWSPDGSAFYYADTATEGVDVFDIDAADGWIHNRRRFVTFGRGEGRPDGLCVDDDGYVWVAAFYSGEVRRFAPDGTRCGEVRVSPPLVTSCSFGGADGDLLFITSSSQRMPEENLRRAGMPPEMGALGAEAPGAGGIFVCRPGVTGPAAVPFRRHR